MGVWDAEEEEDGGRAGSWGGGPADTHSCLSSFALRAGS